MSNTCAQATEKSVRRAQSVQSNVHASPSPAAQQVHTCPPSPSWLVGRNRLCCRQARGFAEPGKGGRAWVMQPKEAAGGCVRGAAACGPALLEAVYFWAVYGVTSQHADMHSGSGAPRAVGGGVYT